MLPTSIDRIGWHGHHTLDTHRAAQQAAAHTLHTPNAAAQTLRTPRAATTMPPSGKIEVAEEGNRRKGEMTPSEMRQCAKDIVARVEGEDGREGGAGGGGESRPRALVSDSTSCGGRIASLCLAPLLSP